MEFDVLIIGGGLAGLSLARQLKFELPEAKIGIIESRKHPAPEAAFKVGESSVEIGAHYYGVRLDLKEHIQQSQLPKLGLRFFFPADDNSDITKRFEVGSSVFPTVPSYQLDRGRFENHIRELNVASGITFIDECRAQDILWAKGTNQNKDALHEVVATKGGENLHFRARWIVDATSRFGLIKRKLSLNKDSSHKNCAVWFRIGKKIAIDNWSDKPEWQSRIPNQQRWLSTNHLMGEGYWVWLIPLASGSTSVGIVFDSKLHHLDEMRRFESALAWLYQHEPQCAKVVDEHRDYLQDFMFLRNYAHSASQVYSNDRWCLTGEAGVFADPFYSPGSDFIAMSNDFITDLIIRDSKGENISERTAIYNRLYLQIYETVMLIFEGQYSHYGNDFIMMQKLLWDSAIYLSVTCLLFFHRKLCDLNFMNRIGQDMALYNRLNFRVQSHFKTMNATQKLHNKFLDFSQTGFFGANLNQQLLTTFEDDEALILKIKTNIKHLEQLAENILNNRDIAADINISKINNSNSEIEGAIQA